MVEKCSFKVNWLKHPKVRIMFYMFYIEPIVFVLVFAHSLSGTIMKNQIIYQTCTVIQNYNESDCAKLGTRNMSADVSAIETSVQKYVADMFMLRTLLESIVPAVCGVFVGSWADRYGRKPLTVISMIGFSCTYIITAIICELSNYYPVSPWYYIIAAIPHSVLGGNCVFMVAAFCFLSDITDVKTRPYRMIFLEVFFFIGLMSGSLLSSFLLAATNATVVFIISGVTICTTTILIIIYMPESLDLHLQASRDEKPADKDVSKSDDDIADTGLSPVVIIPIDPVMRDELDYVAPELHKNHQNAENLKSKPEKSKCTALHLFSCTHVQDMFSVCIKKRPFFDRGIIALITGAMFLSVFIMDGAMTVFYLFVREKFHWTLLDYTVYETFSHMIPMIGALAGFVILRKIFKLSVVTLALLAFLSAVLSNVCIGIASESWQLYLGVALGVFRSISGPMCRTIVSNIVPATDLGKIFSVKNILQSFAPFVAAPLYTFIYKQTININAGLFNIVSAGLFTVAFIFLIFVQRFKYKHSEHYAKILK